MAGAKPAILIVHGGYQLPDVWSSFISTAQKAGFEAHCPRLPTCGDTRPPKASLADDVDAVRTAATGLASSGHSIIVLAHSYGGIVASEAITPEFYKSDGGGVVHMIYLSAWLVLKGQSLDDIIQKYGFQSHVDVGFNEDGTAYAKNSPESFYNDVEPRSRAEEIAGAGVTHNWSAVGAKVESAPWMDLPTTYVHCEQDQAILLDLQKSMVNDAKGAGAAGGFKSEMLDSGHCPFLSMPDRLLSIVEKIAAGL